MGDQVRVLRGINVGKEGIIIRVDSDRCQFVESGTSETLEVFSRDLALWSPTAVALVADTFGPYELHELVILEESQVSGVIIEVAKDWCKILTNKVRALMDCQGFVMVLVLSGSA